MHISEKKKHVIIRSKQQKLFPIADWIIKFQLVFLTRRNVVRIQNSHHLSFTINQIKKKKNENYVITLYKEIMANTKMHLTHMCPMENLSHYYY